MRLTRLRLLREALDRLCEVICVLENLDFRAEFYLVGGAAENRLTVMSDVDIVVVLEHEPSFEEAVQIREKILEALGEAGIPLYLPIDFHIVGPESLRRYRTAKRLECSRCSGRRTHPAPGSIPHSP